MPNHAYLTGSATAAYTNVTGCLRFVGVGRCGLPADDPIHQPHPPATPDIAARQPLSVSSTPTDPAPLEWPSFAATVPVFPRQRSARGPAPDLDRLLHGGTYPRRPSSAGERRRALTWLDCSTCHGPSVSLDTLQPAGRCRDCRERAA